LRSIKVSSQAKIVILQAVRPVRMLEDRVVLKMNDADWSEAMKLPEPRPAAPERTGTHRTHAAAVRADRPALPRR
jgi:hypothetical protein